MRERSLLSDESLECINNNQPKTFINKASAMNNKPNKIFNLSGNNQKFQLNSNKAFGMKQDRNKFKLINKDQIKFHHINQYHNATATAGACLRFK